MNQTWRVNHSSELQAFWLLTVLYLRGAGGNKNKGKKKHEMFLLMIYDNSKSVITGVKYKRPFPEATILL